MTIDIETQLAELRAVAKSLGLMAEPLLDAAPKNGQARRRERDDLITNLRLAEGRIIEAMQWIRIAITAESARATREATRADEAERIIAEAREACPSVRMQDHCDKPLLALVNLEVGRGFNRDAESHKLQAEITTLRASLVVAERQVANLVRLEAAYRESERAMFRRLSDALTDGNAATWDEVADAAERTRHGETR
jgi:hypothetical protein